jgi:hypothetical protein
VTERPPLEDRIRTAFKKYETSIGLLEDFRRERSHPREFVLLAASALDSLANLAVQGKSSQADRFSTFLRDFSGRRNQTDNVAVPNLYSYLAHHYDALPATLPSAGRLRVYDRAIDIPFLRFVADSGLPVAEDDVKHFLYFFSAAIQRKYRTTASQRRTKPHLDSLASVQRHLVSEAAGYLGGEYEEAMDALAPLLKEFTIGSILYRDYRSGAIHQHSFEPDSKFFEESGLYPRTIYHPGDRTRFLDINVSASWLLDLVKASIAGYRDNLIRRKRLPGALFFDIAVLPDEFEFLDVSSIPDPREVPISVGR